jgi:phage terminase large subunit-like protein
MRNPANPTEGGRVALIAEALGTPLMPWQQYVADVAGELNPDGSYVYPVVIVTVPRQSGKTTLMRAFGTERALSRADCGVFYTAQTGKDARERWQDLVKAIKASPLQVFATVRNAAGSERVVFANGSMFRCFAPTAKSLHGYTPPLVMLDEAFAHDQLTGDDLMGAIGPAQITIPHRQLWIVSTMGTAASTFLHAWIEKGRRQLPGVALFDWGAADGVDVYDRATWPTFHPAMVGGLVTADAIAAEADKLSRSEFERAYANRQTRTASNLIPAEVWDALEPEDGQRPPADVSPSELVFGFDVMDDRASSALVAAWFSRGKLQGRVTKSAPGVEWLAETVRQLHAMGWRQFAAAEDGPAREVSDELARPVRDDDGQLIHPAVQVQRVKGQQLSDAWGFLMRKITARQLEHDGSDAFAVSMANVATRPTQDGSAPSRRASAGDITPTVGLMVAAYALEHPEYVTGIPQIRHSA